MPPSSWRNAPTLTGLIGQLSRLALAFCLAIALAACERSPLADAARVIESFKRLAPKRLPNPVESKDGVSYIPIDDTAFLIPEETWLRGYGRNSTDGTVGSITLHATVPDVQPWSQARHEEMYWPAGPGKKLLIYIEGNKADVHLHFHEVPHSRQWRSEFIEEPSDQAAQGLWRFRQSWGPYTEEDAKEGLKKYGPEHVEHRRKNANKPMMDASFYEFVEHDRVKYFIRCSDSKEGLFQTCRLSFPWARTLMIDISFTRDHIGHIVVMADKLSDRLREFEAAGLAYRAAKSQTEPPLSRAWQPDQALHLLEFPFLVDGCYPFVGERHWRAALTLVFTGMPRTAA